jgi:hypothetical protein
MSQRKFGGNSSAVIASQRSRECATGVRSNPWGRSKERMDCFVTRAPRNDIVEPDSILITHPRSRDTVCPSSAQTVSLEKEGAGNAGCALHPRSRVQIARKKAHTSIQVQRRQSGIPCAMVLRLMPCSPRRSGFFGTVALRILARPPGRARAPPQDLTPTSEASGPHGFAVRDQRRRPARRLIAHELIALRHRFAPTQPASTASPPAFVTIAIRPSVGRDSESYGLICISGKQKYFCKWGWTSKIGRLN